MNDLPLLVHLCSILYTCLSVFMYVHTYYIYFYYLCVYVCIRLLSLMRESRLRWFGHVQRRVTNALVRKRKFIFVEGTKKGRGRPKLTLVKVIKIDMSIKGVLENMTLVEWRQRIHMADPN